MAGRSGYQPLAQAISEETDVGEAEQSAIDGASSRGPRRLGRRGSIDLTKLDTAFKRSVQFSLVVSVDSTYLFRWSESIAQKVKRKKKTPTHSRKQIWRSVFEPHVMGIPAPVGDVSFVILQLSE